MKNFYTLLFIIFLCTLSHKGQAQELVKKSTFKDGISEKYLVLKSDKSIKQGQYLQLYNRPLYKDYLMELGKYENNQKSGTWITFYEMSPSNSIKSVGDYKFDKKAGSWSYYYEITTDPGSLNSMLGSGKRTSIVPPGKGELEYKVEINAENHVLESSGQYMDGKKAGTWEYYDRSGTLVQAYDHSIGKLLVDHTEHPDNAFMVYLGGLSRFQSLYYANQRSGVFEHKQITQSSEAVFELEKDGNYLYISGKGDAFMKGHAEKILKSIPNDWIYVGKDPAHTGKLWITCKITKPESTTNHLVYAVELEVVE